jgi:hypothetical protein
MRAFRCSRTGVLFPADYVEEWGRKYGIGLGSVPISEALVNSYHDPVCVAGDENTSMHPLANCRSQVDLVDVTEEEYFEKEAVLQVDDVNMSKRAQVMRDNQLVKSNQMRSMFPHHISLAEDRIKARKASAVVKAAAAKKV